MKCCIEMKSDIVGADLVSARNEMFVRHWVNFGQAQGLPLRFLPFLLMNVPLMACPFCSDNVATGMAKGFFWSILLMLAAPTLVVGVIAGAIWRAGRKKPALPDVHHG